MEGAALSILPANTSVRRICGSVLALTVSLFLILPAAAQQTPSGPPGSPAQGGGAGGGPGTGGAGISLDMNGRGSVVVRVLGPQGAPLKEQALVQLYKIASSILVGGALTNLDSSISFSNLPGFGWYAAEVSAAGYRTQRKEFNLTDNLSRFEVDVTLQPDPNDAASHDVTSAHLPAKAQKHVDKGVAEFRAGNLKDAEKEWNSAYKAAPQNAEISYLLGTLYVRKDDLPRAQKDLTDATSLDPRNVPALIALAHLRYQEADLKAARELLEKAVALDRTPWEALWLLSEIDYHRHDYEKARDEAADAVDFGKGKANAAEFVEALALGQLGKTQEALKMLQAFLRDAPADVNAPAARELAARLQLAMKSSAPAATVPAAFANSSLAAVSAPNLPALDWEPPGVDEEKLPVADGLTCPAGHVIQEAGRRAMELVESVNRIQAKEGITNEELTTVGQPRDVEKRRFNYFVSITDSDSGLPTIDETREGDFGSSQYLGHLSMFGLADLPLIFHPRLRSDFQMTCEGLGEWQHQATWLIYFRQRPDRPERLRSYELLDGTSYTVGLKGRAWIAADTYQIVRLEANLMKPIRQIGLGSEEDVIEYGPVPFQSKKTILWLPKSADIYFYYQHRPFHRHHEFTHYELYYSVSATQKIGQPAAPQEKNDR
jgi:tetratricopeptide (TPR) repeat protein